MSGLIGLLNALAQAALAEQPEGAALRVRSITLDAEGGRILGRVDHAAASGEFVLRFTVDAPSAGQAAPASPSNQSPISAGQQALRVEVERWPDRLPDALEPFRALLERTKLRLELDLSSPPA